MKDGFSVIMPTYNQSSFIRRAILSLYTQTYTNWELIIIKSWRNNWDRLSAYFQYPDGIRGMIYTTNTVEGYHRQIRKVTKNKGVFTNDTALEKHVYLATVISKRSG